MNRRLVANELIKIAKMLLANESYEYKSQETINFLNEYDYLLKKAWHEDEIFEVRGNFQSTNEFFALFMNGLSVEYGISKNPKAYLKNLIKAVNFAKQINSQLAKKYNGLSKEAKNEVNKVVPKGVSFVTLYSVGVPGYYDWD